MDTNTDLSPFDTELLTRYLAGNATASECHLIEQWGAQTAPATARLRQLRHAWDAAGGHVVSSAADDDQMIGRVRTLMQSQKPSAEGRHRRHIPQYSRLRPVYGGATLIATVVVGLTMYTRVDRDDVARMPARAASTYATQAGETATVPFGKGGRIVLAPRTTLVIDGTRMTLTGRALFVIAGRADEVVSVVTGPITTRVLGTVFDVMYAPSVQQAHVAVIEGKVVTGGRRTTVLGAGMAAQVTDSSVTAGVIQDPLAGTRWTQGKLVFSETPVPDVLAAVGQWYGLTFQGIDTVLARRHLTATIDARHSRSEMLALLESSLGVRMRVHGDTIVLAPGWSTHPPQQLRRAVPAPLTQSRDVGR
jgi:transmembrane sensor